jgi:hypothetical protein
VFTARIIFVGLSIHTFVQAIAFPNPTMGVDRRAGDLGDRRRPGKLLGIAHPGPAPRTADQSRLLEMRNLFHRWEARYAVVSDIAPGCRRGNWVQSLAAGKRCNHRSAPASPTAGKTAQVSVLLVKADGSHMPAYVRFFEPNKPDGSYQISQIPPGRYALLINPSGPYDGSPFDIQYYPSTLVPAEAQVFEVTEGQQIKGIDFRAPQLPERA